MTLDSQLAALRDAAPPPPLELARMRERVKAGDRLCAGGSEDVSVHEERFENTGCRVYETEGNCVTLIYVHGGGWVTGDLDYADEFCRELAARGSRVVSVDYLLAPEHPFPAALAELDAVVAAVRRRYGGFVALAGDSAGGNLAAVVAVDSAANALVLIYPALDARMRTMSYGDPTCWFPTSRGAMSWFYEQYAPSVDPTDVRLSPGLRPIAADHPATFVATAEYDPLRDEGTDFVRSLDDAGVVTAHQHYHDLCHGFLRFTGASAASVRARDHLVSGVTDFLSQARNTVMA